MPATQQLETLESLAPDEREAINWWLVELARDEQIAPQGDWSIWLILAGRGFGKTRAGGEQVRQWIKRYPLVNLIAATADDARDIMIYGESGIMAICPTAERPIYLKSERRLDWPNGARSLVFTADEPERLRGKQHMKLWMDELGSWRYAEDAFDQAMLGLRLGDNPQAVITTTPRPIKQIRNLIADPNTVVTRGTTYENRPNLAAAFFARIIRKYEGTRLGRQELNAELLGDVPGALWTLAAIDALRVTAYPDLVRIVVAADPEASSTEDSAETGVIVAGLAASGHSFVLDDASLRGTPGEWGRAVVGAYKRWQADRVVGEVNNGGEMVGFVVLTCDPSVAYKAVHASRGKRTRAEPISMLYEQKLVHHVGAFATLEDQMTNWVPGTRQESPDRLDALVWALNELYYEVDDETEGRVVYDDPVSISPI